MGGAERRAPPAPEGQSARKRVSAAIRVQARPERQRDTTELVAHDGDADGRLLHVRPSTHRQSIEGGWQPALL
jgi:hypothetical protein